MPTSVSPPAYKREPRPDRLQFFRPYGSRTPCRRRRRRRAGRRGGRHASPKTTKLYDRTADTLSATPCGPLASTTRSTSTTTSPPASATTGRDSTAARGQTPAAARRRGCRARRHRRPPGRPPTAAATGLATTDHCGRTSEDLGDSRDGVLLPNGGRVNTLRHQPNRSASRTDYEAAVHCVAGEEHDQHAHFPPRSRASEIRRPLNQIPA